MQHALQTILRLAAIRGKTYIANDTLIFAENFKQDDKSLTQVLERCKSKGITLNLEKKVFFKTILKCYVFRFSKNTVKTGPENIPEIQEAPAPKSKKALRSFLGLTNYMKRFSIERL